MTRNPTLLLLFVLLLIWPNLSCSSKNHLQRGDDATRANLKALETKSQKEGKKSTVALKYADAYLVAVRSGFYDRHPEEKNARYDVYRVLDIASGAQPGDFAKLQTKRAEIDLAVGDQVAGRALLFDVMFDNQYVPAAMMLVSSYGSDADTEKIFEICRSFNPSLDGQSKYAFMEHCAKSSGASSVETGIHWATEEDQAWFITSRKQAQADREREEAEAEARRYNDEQYRNTQIAARNACYSRCGEKNGYCRTQCGYVESCFDGCASALNHCNDGCMAEHPVPETEFQRNLRKRLGF